MSTALLSAGQTNRVGVLGRLTSAAEQAELLSLLAAYEAKADGEPFEVDVYDAETLPAPLVEALVRLVDLGRRLTIVAYRPLLAHCLMRLGLPVRQVAGPRPPAPLARCRALVVGGSAQSLDKMLQIVNGLPVGETTVFVAQHVREDQISLLDRLLQVRTDYRVVMPQHLMAVETSTIYVAPPGRHLKVAHGLVYLTRDGKVNHARPSIDVLFESVAGEYREQCLGVLLCGFGNDGVAGCAALKEVGACVVVEDGDECGAARVLPDAAWAAGRFDHVMKCAGIASFVAAAIAGLQAAPTGRLLDLFLEALWRQYDYDLRGYQRDSLERRLKNLMGQFGLPGFADFQRAVLSQRPLFERLAAEISVGVTGFFRHPEQFRLLRDDVLPYLASFPVLKIWSAGCATGEEAFSLAILLDELGLLPRTRLFATDLNAYYLDLGKSGLFPVASLADSRRDYLASGGPGCFDDYVEHNGRCLKVRERLRQSVLFHRHSLLSEGVFNEFQLIVCRNVMIYFDVENQRKALALFARSLHPDGFLVLGPRDGLIHMASEHGLVPHSTGGHIYRLRRGGAYA
ncbi:chemotaxis protein CheB [Candidatus Accumulibacter vicinus]|uniref:Chemotaxis protein methyltransferase n=1 Tax=Candidatus Accumulibacter vicinus TaxID=2954382 RepID=A0A084Y215_9PROT|nr:chemotaxis protein CheB [Candidatus Accumulibacter vicinus]KFB68759.1 MAG: Chemotaxis protein methyltransferase [Candidatus Accumulibacter vicinus]